MYQLTPRMQQTLQQSLKKYHELFDGGRCLGWELEELIFKAIQSDSTARHYATWTEAGHDDEADIRVVVNNTEYALQIKSGTVKRGYLELSGHRLGRFDGNLEDITEYLNNNSSEILSIPYRKVDDDTGRHHIYRIVYVDSTYLRLLAPTDWEKPNNRKSWRQTNPYGVIFTLHPSMSWQVWWRIPETLLEQMPEFTIG